MGASQCLNDGLVYGNLTFIRVPDNSVRAFADRYDFDIKSSWNPLVLLRNVETWIGSCVAGKGKPFDIYFYGTKKIQPYYHGRNN